MAGTSPAMTIVGPHLASHNKKPGAGPGFSSRRLLAPPLARVQRQADRIGLLPHRAFRALELGADASRVRLRPRHRPERAKVALRPIAANSSPGSHFHTLHLVGTDRCITVRGKSLSQSTNRVTVREESLICAQELCLATTARYLSASTLVQIFAAAASRREPSAKPARFLLLFQKEGESRPIHPWPRSCWLFRPDKSGTSGQDLSIFLSVRVRRPSRTEVLVDLAAGGAMLY